MPVYNHKVVKHEHKRHYDLPMSRTKKLITLVAVLVAGLLGNSRSSSADPTKSTHPHVATVLTPMTRTELLGALREGHVKAFGRLPSRERMAMAWGQVAFENGQGRWTYNHNLGNVGTTASNQPAYYNRGDGHWYRHAGRGCFSLSVFCRRRRGKCNRIFISY